MISSPAPQHSYESLHSGFNWQLIWHFNFNSTVIFIPPNLENVFVFSPFFPAFDLLSLIKHPLKAKAANVNWSKLK